MTYDLTLLGVPYIESAFFETIFLLLTPRNEIVPYVTIMLYVCLTIYLLVVLIGVGEYNMCMHIFTIEGHLSLGSDWLVLVSMEDALIRHLASVCTTHYSLHPPSSNKNKFTKPNPTCLYLTKQKLLKLTKGC